MKLNKSLKKILKSSIYLTLLLCWSVRAEVVTDGSVGVKQSLSGQMIIPQDLGTTKGNNLFHSFKTFNISIDESATFTGSDNLKNVINRVTGGEVSKINGLLKSKVGQASFYFINPAGVTFGANSSVDVPAAFHVSTADKLKFANGSEFSAANPNPVSTLMVAEPASFGFVRTATHTGTISINGSQIALKPRQTLDLVANDISIKDNAVLKVPAGEIRIVAIQGGNSVSLERTADGNLPLPAQLPSLTNAGNITLDSK
jgi:filamentous hemagglutinin family protein